MFYEEFDAKYAVLTVWLHITELLVVRWYWL